MQTGTDRLATGDVVASLIVEFAPASDSSAGRSGMQRRPLVHLARTDADAHTGRPVYALGFPFAADGSDSGDVGVSLTWTSVGPLNLETTPVERVLLAGLSALALKHVREAEVQIGDPVVVLGNDPWSLLVLQWARLQGASPLVFANRGPRLLGELASGNADATLMDPSPRDIAQAIQMTHRGAGFAVVFDAIASEQSISFALPALRDGGRYVLAGLDPKPYVMLNAYPDLHRRDLEMISPMHSAVESDMARLFRFSLDLAEQGRLRLSGLLDPALGWRASIATHA